MKTADAEAKEEKSVVRGVVMVAVWQGGLVSRGGRGGRDQGGGATTGRVGERVDLGPDS